MRGVPGQGEADIHGDLREQRIVVTGASRGLGRAFAQALAAEGAKVVVNATDPTKLGETVELIEAAGGTAVPVIGSVADPAVAEQMVKTCVAEFGGIDCLVNNAGIVRDRTLLNMSVEEFDDVIAVHLRGTFLCGQAAARAMKDTGGQIINVVSAFEGQVGQSNYAAAKAGIASLTRTWANELKRYGIRVNGVWPVAVTDMTQVMLERLEGEPRALGFGQPEEVAQVVVYLASPRAQHLTGEILSFNGQRFSRWTFPAQVDVETRDNWTAADFSVA